MKATDVLIVGAGPTGLMLAAELRLHGLQVVVLERDSEPTLVVRAGGLHPRSIEILDQRGLLPRFAERATRHPVTGFLGGLGTPPPTDLDTSHPYQLHIAQPVVERLLEEHANESGALVRRGVEVVSVGQTAELATIGLGDGTELAARFVVGCDGGRSTVRKLLGVAFPGEASTQDTLIGAMRTTAPPAAIIEAVDRVRRTEKRFGLIPLHEDEYRVVVPAPDVARERVTPTIDDFRRQLRSIAGTDFGVHSPSWLSRFGNATRLAETYRRGRVFLAGDAAHVHPPAGGQGLNLGLQDAFNLGWKMAAAVNGWAPADLLDSYEKERRPVAADVLNNTRAQIELMASGPGPEALRNLLGELMQVPAVNRMLTEKIIATGIRYDFGSSIDLLGRRLRDFPLEDTRLYDHMHDGKGMLLDRDGSLHAAGWQDRVRAVPCARAELPASGVLLRPDGHIAWFGEGQSELQHQLTRWFGAPSRYE